MFQSPPKGGDSLVIISDHAITSLGGSRGILFLFTESEELSFQNGCIAVMENQGSIRTDQIKQWWRMKEFK